jgi:hypothetical protein
MKEDHIFIGFIGLLIAILFLIIGVTIGQEKEHTQAIKAGVGHWEVNPTNRTTTFIYSK